MITMNVHSVPLETYNKLDVPEESHDGHVWKYFDLPGLRLAIFPVEEKLTAGADQNGQAP